MISGFYQDFPGGSDGKASAYNAGDLGLIPGWGRSSGEGNGNPLQYSCLENPMGEAWLASVNRVANSRTRLSDFISLQGSTSGNSIRAHFTKSWEGGTTGGENLNNQFPSRTVPSRTSLL